MGSGRPAIVETDNYPSLRLDKKGGEGLTLGGDNIIFGDMGLRFSKINGEHSIQDDAAAVNPNLAKGAGYQLNCGNCAAAYEMRRRGFDVEAAPGKWMTRNDWLLLFDGFNMNASYVEGRTSVAAVNEISKKALFWGEGARGMVYGEWKGRGFGHFFSFEVSGGEVKFLNPQDPSTNAESYFNDMSLPSVIYGRVDNLKPKNGVESAVIDKGR